MTSNMNAPKLFRIIGDSHVHSLTAAFNLKQAETESAGVKIQHLIALTAATDLYEPFYVSQNGVVRIIDEKIKTRLTGILCDEDGRIFSSDGVTNLISMGLHTNTFIASKRWDNHRYWKTSKRQGCQPVSDAAFDEMVDDINRYIYGFISELTKLGHAIKIISSPPPTRRFQVLSRGWTEDDVFLVDERFRSAVVKRFNSMGVDVIMPPRGVCKSGYLRDEYLNVDTRDVHHGNLSYSLLMLDGVIAAITSDAS